MKLSDVTLPTPEEMAARRAYGQAQAAFVGGRELVEFEPGPNRIAESMSGRIPSGFAIQDVELHDSLSETRLEISLVRFAMVGDHDGPEKIEIGITALDVPEAERILDELLPNLTDAVK